MKNLKTTIFSVTLLGTTFVALGYWCEKCRTHHEWPGECVALANLSCDRENYNTMFKEDFYKAIKGKISHCRNVGEARCIMDEIRGVLSTKEEEIRKEEWEIRCRSLLNLSWTQERINEVRKLLDHVSTEMINHSIRRDCGFCFDDEILNWSEVFGSDCETTPALPNHGDGWNEVSNEPDLWDSGYASSPFGC
ncbi:MAG: hypothetical protein ACSW8C_03325 [bacterium]